MIAIGRVSRLAVFLFLCAPGGALLAAFLTGRMATPYRTILHETGEWSMRLLVLGLLLSPLAQLTRLDWLTAPRRMIGLFAAGYAFIHAWAWCRQYGYDWSFLLGEVQRLYLLLGLVATLMLAPLAATSNAWGRRMLGAAWARLHQLAYPISALALLHFILSRATIRREAMLHAVLLALAFGWRVLRRRTS